MGSRRNTGDHTMIKHTREELVRCRNLVLQLQKDCRTLECRRRELINELRDKEKLIKQLEEKTDDSE